MRIPGCGVPFIAYQPGTIKLGSIYNVAIGIEDIFPTVLIPVEQGGDRGKMALSGQSILSLFTDPTSRKKQYSRDTFFWHTAGGGYNPAKKTYTPTQTAIRKGDYKLIFDDQGYLELYNIATDLSEAKNLARKSPGALQTARHLARQNRPSEIPTSPKPALRSRRQRQIPRAAIPQPP